MNDSCSPGVITGNVCCIMYVIFIFLCDMYTVITSGFVFHILTLCCNSSCTCFTSFKHVIILPVSKTLQHLEIAEFHRAPKMRRKQNQKDVLLATAMFPS